MAPTPINLTFGTIAGFTVGASQRPAVGSDVIGGRTAIIVTLKNGSTVYEVGSYEDNMDGANKALAVGNALINGFASIGAQVTLGDPTTPIVATSGRNGPYTRAVDIAPGTRLPPGRGVYIKSPQLYPIGFRLADGGVIQVVPSGDDGDAGTVLNGIAAVEVLAPLPTGALARILY